MTAAIRVESLGKRYRVAQGGQRAKYRTLRESLVESVAAPFRRSASGTATAEDFWALQDVSFEVQPGEVVGIIGRNGAGKSTLLKILSRITKPTKGRVEINGRVGSLLEVGTGFHPELTGRENIYLNGSILGMSRKEIDRKFDEIVAFAEVEKFLDTPVKRYSSGMYVRLAFAVAAHLEPEILIVDEVLAVGDAGFQKKCLGKMQSVAREGRTVLVVSHNLPQVLKTCSRGVYLSRGTVDYDGTIEMAAAKYTNAHVGPNEGLSEQGISVKFHFADEAGDEVDVWRYGTPLIAMIEVDSVQSLNKPAVDLAFYDDAGVRLFAVQSDRVADPPADAHSRVVFRIRIENSVLNCSHITVDLGIRESPGQKYVAWWQQVRTLPIANAEAPAYFVPGTILGLPYEVATTVCK
jgi:lipopolysaccharide transport system ATP-binding protein